MSAPSDSLAERYGAPARWRGRLLLAAVVVLVAGLSAYWFVWVIPEQSDPAVSSQLIRSDIVDDHQATAVIRVTYGDDEVGAHCTVRAIAVDKTVVGEAPFTPDQAGDYDVTIATERRATAVENVGCTTEGQPRPR